MNSELRKLNFRNLLMIDQGRVNEKEYDFEQYALNEYKHPIKGYCTRCEEKGCNICPQEQEFRLLNISHGSSTDDMLSATATSSEDMSDWHQEGVLFLMESPSIDGWGLYGEVEYNGYKKRPAQLWYWYTILRIN